MKPLFFILTYLASSTILMPPKNIDTKSWYMVTEKDYYILDLEYLQRLEIDGIPSVTFNNSSIYKNRLATSRGKDWMDNTRNGLIYDEQTDQSQIGNVVIKDKQLEVMLGERGQFFTIPLPNYLYQNNRLETIYKDGILIVALYHFISTGSSLIAIDTKEKTLLWQADVQQLNVGHSEYYNKVYLSLYKNKIIMEGVEAYGHYLQVFDFQAGKRLYSSLPKF